MADQQPEQVASRDLSPEQYQHVQREISAQQQQEWQQQQTDKIRQELLNEQSNVTPIGNPIDPNQQTPQAPAQTAPAMVPAPMDQTSQTGAQRPQVSPMGRAFGAGLIGGIVIGGIAAIALSKGEFPQMPSSE